MDLELLDGTCIVTRPMYGGVIHIRAELQGLPPFIVSLQNGALRAKTLPRRAASLLPIPVEISEADIRAKVVGLLQAATGEIDITKADIIVAVGRGIREKANIQLARDMADALGGVVACSRPLADLGWLPPECHVGMSGKIVKPKVYIACGISGASHHVAGMKDSHTIIAINKDPGAPIFQVAHFGVVRDLFEIMPVLTNQCIK